MNSSMNRLTAGEPIRAPETATARPESSGAGVSAVTGRLASEAVLLTGTHPAAADAVIKAVREINDFVKLVQRHLEFTVNEDTGRTVITVRDSETEEVIRQIPPERVLAIAKNLQEVHGLLVQAEA